MPRTLDAETDHPETLDELRTVAEQIKAANVPGVTDPPVVLRIQSWPLEFLISGAREPIVDNDNGRTAVWRPRRSSTTRHRSR